MLWWANQHLKDISKIHKGSTHSTSTSSVEDLQLLKFVQGCRWKMVPGWWLGWIWIWMQQQFTLKKREEGATLFTKWYCFNRLHQSHLQQILPGLQSKLSIFKQHVSYSTFDYFLSFFPLIVTAILLWHVFQTCGKLCLESACSTAEN